MIYQVYLFNSETGLLFWSKTFEKLTEMNEDLFASFFSAIQSFVTEMVLEGGELNGISMGNYFIRSIKDQELHVDLVIIFDKGDVRRIEKFIPKFFKLLSSRKNLFERWNGDQTIFNSFGVDIINIIERDKILMRRMKSIIDDQDAILNKILSNRPDVDFSTRAKLEREQSEIQKELLGKITLLQKQNKLKKLYENAETLKDINYMKVIQEIQRKNLIEINETKVKILFYLTELKKSLNETIVASKNQKISDIDFKYPYLSLYPMANKISYLGNENLGNDFKEYAKILMEKPEDKINQIPEIISKILNTNESIV